MQKHYSEHFKALNFALFLGIVSTGGYAQTFQNLDFEQADVSHVTYNSSGHYQLVPYTEGLPGWYSYDRYTFLGGTVGTSPSTSKLYYDSFLLDDNGTAILDRTHPTNNVSFYPANPVISGNFSAEIYASSTPQIGFPGLAQTGLIPISANSIQFSTRWGVNAGQGLSLLHLHFWVDGNEQELIGLEASDSSYSRWGVDISGFAGGTHEIQFVLSADSQGEGSIILDDVTFSPTSVPEPGSFSLLGMGLCAFYLVRIQNRRSY